MRFLYSHERLEQFVEGGPDVLIENGEINLPNCQRDLITLSELESAAHRQGFATLNDVERAVMEPGGTISFFAKKPTPEITRHDQIMERLQQIAKELAALRAVTRSGPVAGN